MDPHWVEALGTWFSGLLIAGSLVFVWLQTRHMREQTVGTRQATYQKLYDMWFAIDQVFIEHADLRPYFYEARQHSEEKGLPRNRLDAIAQFILDCFDDVYQQRDFMPPKTYEAWGGFMRDVYRGSPYLVDFLGRNERWYPPNTVQFLKYGN